MVGVILNNYRILWIITRTTDNPHTPCFYHRKKQKLTDYPHRCITHTPIHSFLPDLGQVVGHVLRHMRDNVDDNKIEQVKCMQDVGSIYSFVSQIVRPILVAPVGSKNWDANWITSKQSLGTIQSSRTFC